MRFLLLLFASVCFAQPAPDKSAISGRIVSASTGAPLKKASVWIEAFAPARSGNTAPTVPAVVTDAEGRFSMDGIPAGSYLLMAKRVGYLDQGYGAPSPDTVGPPLELAAGEAKRDLVLKLTPQALVYGKVVDEDGDPIPNAQVEISRVSYSGGRRHLMGAASSDSQDDGSFVAGNLTPGRYYLRASLRNLDQDVNSRERLVATYYPAAADAADATAVDVAAGAEVRGLTIRVRRSRVYRVRGRAVFAENSAPAARVELQLAPLPRAVACGDDGSFEFEGVAPGRYSIESAPHQGLIAGPVEVAVADADRDGVAVTVGPGVTVSGHLTGGRAGSISLTPGRAEYTAEAPVEENGGFRLDALLPAVFTIAVSSLPDGSFVKSIQFQGRRLPDWQLDLTSGAGGELVVEVSPDGGEVAGKVDKPGAIVQIWPAGGDSARSVKADARGEFRFGSLAPGDYRVIAWQDIDDDLAEYAPFRARFEADAASVHVGERRHERVEPQLVGRDAIAVEAAKLK